MIAGVLVRLRQCLLRSHCVSRSVQGYRVLLNPFYIVSVSPFPPPGILVLQGGGDDGAQVPRGCSLALSSITSGTAKYW